MDGMKAGAGKSEIRFPAEMFPIEGFNGIHDNPCARILVLESGVRAAFVSMELVMVDDEMLDVLKGLICDITGTAKENIWILATHTITTPHPPRREPEKKPAYEKAIVEAVTTAAVQAAVMKDAVLEIGEGTCDINRNRDRLTPYGWWIGPGADGPSSKRLMVLSVKDAGGAMIGALVNYDLKPSAIDNAGMADGSRKISGDVTGAACALAEEEWGAPCLYMTGAAADQVPAEQAWYEELDEEGRNRQVDLGVEKGLELAGKYGRMLGEAIMDTAAAGRRMPAGRIIRREDSFRWDLHDRIERKPQTEITYVPLGKSVELPVDVIVLGDIAMVAEKPEVCHATEQELLARSPFPVTMLFTMVNGGMKYMPDQESCRRVTWETIGTMLMPGAAEKFVDVAAGLLASASQTQAGN